MFSPLFQKHSFTCDHTLFEYFEDMNIDQHISPPLALSKRQKKELEEESFGVFRG